MIPKYTLLIIILFFMLAAGCSSSEIINSWKPKDILPKKYDKVLVLAILNEDERKMRLSIENHLVDDLKQNKINAFSSIQEYGPKSFAGLEEKEVFDKLENTGIDAVLTIVLLNKSKERSYVPGRVYHTPYFVYQRRFWGYYTTIYERVYEPGYYTESTSYFWESNFYDMNSKELKLSVQTRSFNPDDAETLGHEYGKLICKELLKNGVIRAIEP